MTSYRCDPNGDTPNILTSCSDSCKLRRLRCDADIVLCFVCMLVQRMAAHYGYEDVAVQACSTDMPASGYTSPLSLYI